VVFPEGGAEFALGLDVDAFTDRLGADHVLLLRLHYMLSGRLGAIDHPAVREVSFHPEVSELYLAADVLVTDYSSSMFDFAVTGKPIFFLAYDLADFESRQRGFYFDLAPIAPGPIVTTTAELVDALEDLPAVSEHYAERYRHFQETFCALEDGHATERVLDHVLMRAPGRAATG
jgi:CDP-glycerol glycerophosphotransferase